MYIYLCIYVHLDFSVALGECALRPVQPRVVRVHASLARVSSGYISIYREY